MKINREFMTISNLACFLIVATACLADDSTLLKHATRITTLSGTDVRYLSGDVYCWESNDKLLIVRNQRYGEDKLILRDILTNKETYLKKLSARFNGAGAGLTSSIQMSSDGQWLMWVNEGDDGAQSGVFGCNISATKKFQILNYVPDVAWIPGSSTWLEIGIDFVVRGLNGKAIDRIRLNGLKIEAPLDSLMLSNENGSVFVFMIENHKYGNIIPIEKYRIGKPVRLVKRTVITFPSDMDIVSYHPKLSPDGKYISFPGKDINNKAQGIWICDLDRGSPHKIGQLNNFPHDELYNFARAIQWSPDSKRLSFIYKKTLWVIPVFKPNSTEIIDSE